MSAPIGVLGVVSNVVHEPCRYCDELIEVATVRRGKDWWAQSEHDCPKAPRTALSDLVDAEVFGDGGAF